MDRLLPLRHSVFSVFWPEGINPLTLRFSDGSLINRRAASNATLACVENEPTTSPLLEPRFNQLSLPAIKTRPQMRSTEMWKDTKYARA